MTVKKQQKGFTLIELIMVIVILGILSAFALPRFADFGDSARQASADGLAGAMRSAVGITRSQQLADGSGLDGSVELEGQTVTMIAGAPTADEEGIGRAVEIDGYTSTGGGDGEGDTITYEVADGCTVAYTAGTTDNGSIDDRASVLVDCD